MSACESTSPPIRTSGTLRLSKPPPAKVAAMVAAIRAPPVPTPPPPAPTAPESAKPRPTEAALKAAAHAQQGKWRDEDLALCRERFPELFNIDRPKPLAVGVHKPLAKVLGNKRAKRLLQWWAHWKPYVAAVAAGGMRYNLDGTEAGEISEQHRLAAQAALGMEIQPLEKAA